MARKGEVSDIVSRKQYDYFLKQALSAQQKKDKHHRPVTKGGQPVNRAKPLDSRGQPHRAKRDDAGRVTEPGGGKADAPPSANQAMQAIMKFHSQGGSREALPKVSDTRNAARKDLEHAKMRRDKVIRPAVRPPGTAEYSRALRRRQQEIQTNSKEYLSKSINERFGSALDEALGL
jgi:hypothetical protein